MSLKIRKLEDLNELMDLLTGRDDDRPDSVVPIEEAEARYRRGCRLAYNVSRNTLDDERNLAHCMLVAASERLHGEHGLNVTCAALLLQAFAFYIEVEQGADKEAFKTKFILSLDKAVESLGHEMRETHDTWTEQSTQERSAEPPKTP